jgi:hypothetical protein
MNEDKQDKVVNEILRIAKEDVPFGKFKLTIKVHQGKIVGMEEEHKERTTIIV